MSYPRNMTGEEAFAARSLMTPLSFEDKWLHDLFDSKDNIPSESTLPKREILEEGEVPDERTPSAPLLKSQPSSTLYSIPQWQPPSLTRPETSSQGGNGPVSRTPLPNSKRNFWQDPRHWGVASTQVARPVAQRQSYRPQNVVSTHTALSTFTPIPDLEPRDKLDQRIGIWPRGKTSADVQLVLSPDFLPPFPHAMLVIIHQFMAANQFVSPRKHLGGTEKKNLWKSLLVRLDLHESDDLLWQENERLRGASVKLNKYVDDRSLEWLAAGIYIRPSKKQPPTFHECTQAWLRRDWDGVIILPTHVTTMEPAIHRTSVQSVCDKAKIEDRVPSIDSLVPRRSTNVRAEAVNVTKAIDTRHTFTTSRTRRASDDTNVPAPKRLKGRVQPQFSDRFLKALLSTPGDEADLQFVRPHDKGFPRILDDIRHAHHTLEELAPKSVKDLAALQQDWADHGFPSSLTESLFLAQSYTLSMKSYLDNALDLLLLLEDCTSWKVEGDKFELELEHEDSATQSGPSSTSERPEPVNNVQ